MPFDSTDAARRRFLKWLATGPIVAAGVPALQALAQATSPLAIDSAAEALNVFELEAVARHRIPPAHWAYLSTGVLDDRTILANRGAYDRWGIRTRRLVDVSRVDLETTLFGERWKSPIALAPVSSQTAFHPEGEVAVAAGAADRGALQILSTLTTYSIEDVMKARGGAVWQQLYTTSVSALGEQVLARAQAAGASAIVFTVDLLGGGQRRETAWRDARADARPCGSCHAQGWPDLSRKRMFDGLDVSDVLYEAENASLTWDYLSRLRDLVTTRLLVKGVMTPEDADIAVRRGVDGIIVSNHGGRAEESLVGTLDVLPAIAKKVRGRVPILLDGGIRRGTDAFKALALGADMVCIGRPYVWGLGAFGREGVVTALERLDEELASTMRQAGITRVAEIARGSLVALR